jgi:hypothetical protein
LRSLVSSGACVDLFDDGKGGRKGTPVVIAEGREDAGHHGVAAPVGGFDGGAAFCGQHNADGAGVVRIRFPAGQSCPLELDDLLGGAGHPDAQVPGDLTHPDAVVEQHFEGAQLGGAQVTVRIEAADQVHAVPERLAEVSAQATCSSRS